MGEDDLELGKFFDTENWDAYEASKLEVLLTRYDGMAESELALLLVDYYAGSGDLDAITALCREILCRRLIKEEEKRVYNSWLARLQRSWQWGSNFFEHLEEPAVVATVEGASEAA